MAVKIINKVESNKGFNSQRIYQEINVQKVQYWSCPPCLNVCAWEACLEAVVEGC